MKGKIYLQDGRVAGKIAGHTYYTTRKRSIHQLRHPPAWAIDRGILSRLAQKGVTDVSLLDAESGTKYVCAVSDFWRHGIAINRGHGEQVALPLAHWRTTSADDGDGVQQLALFAQHQEAA